MNGEMKNLKLEGLIELKSPMSHIGESLGVDSYLSEQKIISPEGEPVECFVYSGNAFRGQLRDCAVKYLLDRLQIEIPAESFHLLFSGGTLGGRQNLDISQARDFRKLIPAFSIFGGGVGNQILAGKLCMGQGYPIVEETMRVVPERYHLGSMKSWRHWTMEQSFTRKDDSKDENLRPYLQTGDEQEMLDGEVEEQEKEKDDGPAQQMRYTVELLAPGSLLYQRIDLKDMTELEIGAFVSALTEFSKRPYIGGKSNVGMGLVEIEYLYTENTFAEAEDMFMKIGQDQLHLSEPAEAAKEKYDAFLLDLYNAYIEGEKEELKQLLSGSG